MKYHSGSSIKAFFIGGLLLSVSGLSVHAETNKAASSRAEPWYQPYMGLPLLDSNGNKLGTSVAIALDPTGNTGAKIIVKLNAEGGSDEKVLQIPLKYVGYFQDQKQMKLIEPLHKLQKYVSVLGADANKQEQDVVALQTLLQSWNR